MIVFSKKAGHTGGKRQHVVRKLSATSAEDFERLTDYLRKNQDGWWGHWPTEVSPWAHADKRAPHVWLRETGLPVVVRQLGAVEMPATYFELVVFRLKREMWEMYWPHAGREPDGRASKYWADKMKWLAGKIITSGEWVPDPGVYIPDTPCDEDVVEVGLKIVNGWIENLRLRHRNRLNSTLAGQSTPIEG